MADKEYRLGIPGERINNALIEAEKIVSYKPDLVYAAGDVCVHKGEVWTNTGGDSTQGVEPGTNYNVWNVGYSNPNLLDNPWFTVNQRGITSWTNGLYGADRWKIYEGSASYSNELVQFSKGSYLYGLLVQPMEASVLEKLQGSTLTMSVKFSDNTIISGTVNYFNITAYNNFLENPNGLTLDFDNSISSFRLYIRGDGDVLIRAVKLELGSVSTLANDVTPDYATELLKCQRYFQKDSVHTTYYTSSASALAVNVFLKASMRIVPSVTVSECAYWNGSAWISVGYNVVDQLGSTGYFSCWINNVPQNGQYNIIIRYEASADL